SRLVREGVQAEERGWATPRECIQAEEGDEARRGPQRARRAGLCGVGEGCMGWRLEIRHGRPRALLAAGRLGRAGEGQGPRKGRTGSLVRQRPYRTGRQKGGLCCRRLDRVGLCEELAQSRLQGQGDKATLKQVVCLRVADRSATSPATC